jgi:pyruvyl transferase EpsO
MVSDGRVVVTDRLHATVLAALLGRPVVARDNSTHKISTIYEDYLRRFPSVSLATDAESAAAMVREHLAADSPQ